VPYWIKSADFNRDGRPDIVVSFQNSGNFALLLGTGTGGFNVAVVSTSGTGNQFEEFAVGDLNRDGLLDLVFPRYHDKKLIVLLGSDTGSFHPRFDVPLTRNPLAAIISDFNRDGNNDVAATVATATAVANFTNYYVSVLPGDGAGGFGTATDYEVGQYPQTITTGDFDGDNRLDLVTADSQSDQVSILTGDGAGGFSLSVPFAVAAYPSSVAVADFNRDGKPDLAVAQFFANSVSLLLNNYSAAVPCLSVNDAATTEGDAGASDTAFTVSLSQAAGQRVRVNFRVNPIFTFVEMGSFVGPTPGVDYQPVAGTLVFEPGETTKTINVPVNGDNLDEYDESFAVILSNPTGAALHDARGIGTILDDDNAPTVSIQRRNGPGRQQYL